MIELPFAVIPLPLGVTDTGNERAERPAQHLQYPKHPGLIWQTNGPANAWVRGDLGSAQAIDFAALIATNALPATQYRLRLANAPIADADAGTYDSGWLPVVAPAITRADGRYHSFLSLGEPSTARYWRIDIDGHVGDFSASALVLGERLTPASYYDNAFKFETQDLGKIEFTRFGVPDETDGAIFRAVTLKFGWLDQTDWEEKFRAMSELLGNRGAIYFCFDPAPTVYRQAKTYLGVFKEAPYATGGVKPGSYESEFQILSVI